MTSPRPQKMKALAICLLVSLGVGALAGLLTGGSADMYAGLQLPPLAPPGWLFPVVWGVLYALMGISSFLVVTSRWPDRRRALVLYVLQLAVNFCWPLVFFGAGQLLAAFAVLVVLWVLVGAMILAFAQVDKRAAWLQIPYLLWITFAGYLNLGIVLLNGASI